MAVWARLLTIHWKEEAKAVSPRPFRVSKLNHITMRAAAAARLLAPRLFRRAPATASLVSSQSLPFCSLPIQSPLVHSPPPPPCSYSLQLHSPPCYASLARSNLAHTSNHASLFALGSLLFLGGGAQLDDGSAHCEGDNSGTSQCAASRHNLHGATSPKHADAMDTPPFPTPSDIMATFARMKDDAKAEGTRNKGRKRKLKSTVSKSPVEEVAVKIPPKILFLDKEMYLLATLAMPPFGTSQTT